MKFILRHWPVIFLALWFAGISVFLDTAVRRFESRTTSTPPTFDLQTPWRHARFFTDPDSYCWLFYARELRASHRFRVRFTHFDNAPYGRPVHWGHLPIWLLCATSFVLEKCGSPPPIALELAGRALLPAVGFLTFSLLWLFLRKRLPATAAGLLVCAPAVVLLWDFHPFRPDQQAFQLAAAFFFSVFLLFSDFGFATAGKRPPRAPFILSGIAGGCALWFGASVFYFSLCAAAVASALVLFFRPRKDESLAVHPDVWRLWGMCGAAASILFWLLEYAPNHFAMRLEVNHPLYALSFLGIGETLYWMARYRHVSASLSPRRITHLFLALAVAAALPVLILGGPKSFYWLKDILMFRLHARHIDECLSLSLFAAQSGRSFFPFLLLAVGPGIAALACLLFRPTLFAPAPDIRRRLLFAIPFFVVFTLCYIWQVRWKSFAIWSSLLLVAAMWPSPPANHRPARHALFLALPLLVQTAVFFFLTATSAILTFQTRKIDPMYLEALQQRNLALNWKQFAGNARLRLLAPFSLAPVFHYFGLGDSVASLYWENLEGDAAAASAFADTSTGASTALRLVELRHITHVLMLEGAQDALMSYNLQTGRNDHLGASRTLGGLLAGAIPGAPLPRWLTVDSELNRTVNPPWYTYIPHLNQWYPSSYPMRIYTVRQAPLPSPVPLPSR